MSGEDFQYLLVGCAFLAEKGAFHYFSPSEEHLTIKRNQPGMQNFPLLNWALRYTLDKDTSIRLPYQEYLQAINRPGGIAREFLDEIKVTITEAELVDGLAYVARHVDDDQAIYLLMKLRKSILQVKEHGFQIDYEADAELDKTDKLLAYAWKKRGYLPGLKQLTQAALGLSRADNRGIDALLRPLPSDDPESVEKLQIWLSEPSEIESLSADGQEILCDLSERMDALGIQAKHFLQLASLNPTRLQFDRIIGKKGLRRQLMDQLISIKSTSHYSRIYVSSKRAPYCTR